MNKILLYLFCLSSFASGYDFNQKDHYVFCSIDDSASFPSRVAWTGMLKLDKTMFSAQEIEESANHNPDRPRMIGDLFLDKKISLKDSTGEKLLDLTVYIHTKLYKETSGVFYDSDITYLLESTKQVGFGRDAWIFLVDSRQLFYKQGAHFPFWYTQEQFSSPYFQIYSEGLFKVLSWSPGERFHVLKRTQSQLTSYRSVICHYGFFAR